MTRSIDIRQLRYFVTVAQERSFRRAAERLHLTQPPLSRQVRDLEDALGTRLLARDTRRVRLTAAGELALREFGSLVATFDATVARVVDAAPGTARLRLGTIYWSSLNVLAGTERALQKAGLAAGLDIQTLASHEALAALRGGDLDAALIAGPSDTGRLETTVLGTLPMAAFVPAGSPLARRRVLALRDLLAAPPFYRFQRHINPPLHDHFARQFETHGFYPRALASAREVMGVLAQIASGRGSTCMPASASRFRYPGVVRRPLVETVTMDLVLVTSPRLDAAIADLLRTSLRRLLPASVRAGPKRPGKRSSTARPRGR